MAAAAAAPATRFNIQAELDHAFKVIKEAIQIKKEVNIFGADSANMRVEKANEALLKYRAAINAFLTILEHIDSSEFHADEEYKKELRNIIKAAIGKYMKNGTEMESIVNAAGSGKRGAAPRNNSWFNAAEAAVAAAAPAARNTRRRGVRFNRSPLEAGAAAAAPEPAAAAAGLMTMPMGAAVRFVPNEPPAAAAAAPAQAVDPAILALGRRAKRAGMTRRHIRNFFNTAFTESPHQNIRNAYTAFKRDHPDKNAFNAVSDFNINNNSTRRLRNAIIRDRVNIPEQQRHLARQWKENILAVEEGSRESRNLRRALFTIMTRRNNRK